jgi:hypothetical protein
MRVANRIDAQKHTVGATGYGCMEPCLVGGVVRIKRFLILQNLMAEAVFNVGLIQADVLLYPWFICRFNRLPYWRLDVAWRDLEIDCDLRQPRFVSFLENS